MIRSMIQLYRNGRSKCALTMALLCMGVVTGCSQGATADEPQEQGYQPAPEFQPLPDIVAEALRKAGFPNAAVVTVAQPGEEPQVLVDRNNAQLQSEPIVQPPDIRLGGIDFREGVRLIYYHTGSTHVTDCPKYPPLGSPWVCKRVNTR